MKNRALLGLALLIVAIACAGPILQRVFRNPGPDGRYRVSAWDVQTFEGIVGPQEATTVRVVPPTSWREFGKGGPSRLAILLTEEDSPWLALAHGLRSIGVPFVITRDPHEAVKHHVVFVYPYFSGRVLSAEALDDLEGFVRGGGTLIAQHVLGGGRNELFGFAEAREADARTHVVLQDRDGAAAQFPEPEERELHVGSGEGDTRGLYAYTGLMDAPVARYDDGSAAIVRRDHGRGRAYALGMDIGYQLYRGQTGRQEGLSRSVVNGYTPTLDVLLRLVRAWYVAGEPNAATLHTVPDGKALTVLVTHDVDYSRSLHNAMEYAELERRHRVPATYFVQAKYVRDWNDVAFYDQDAARVVARLAGAGMEIASHSVSHSLRFNEFPMGDGSERYPDYTPFVKSKDVTYNGTLLGELRASRHLLEASTGARVVSFRPGHLRRPLALSQALEATGYRYSSTVTANQTLTHLPFRAYADQTTAAQVDVYEFPITVEDERDGPMIERLPEAISLARKLERYGATFVLLIHPDVTGQKLAFERGLLEALGDRPWYGTVSGFGAWWAARDRLEVDVQPAESGGIEVRVEAPEAITGLRIVMADRPGCLERPVDLPPGVSILRCP